MENYIAKIKSEIKKDLIDHYDFIKSEIDYLIHKKVDNIERIDYSKLIQLCDKIFNINLEQVNQYFDKNKFEKNYKKLNKEIVKEKILTKYCVFIGSEQFQRDLKNFLIGHLIISDWYIDENQYNFLKIILHDKVNESDKFDFDDNIMALETYFKKKFPNGIYSNGNEILSSELGDNSSASQNIVKILSIKRCDLIKNQKEFIKTSYFFNLNNYLNYRSFKSCMFSNHDKINDLTIRFSETYDENFNNHGEVNYNGILSTFGYFKKLKSLDLTRCNLSMIKNQPLKSLSNLKTLKMSENLIENIEHDSFIGLNMLDKLDLSKNKIKEVLSDKCFNDLKKLSCLKLDYNNIDKLEYDCFMGLDKLNHLNLSSNMLKIIAKQSFNGLQKLNTLNLSNNEINNILDDRVPILRLDKRFSLSLVNLNFSGLDNLTDLNLSNNKLEKIDKDFSIHLNNLKILNLSGNRIKDISLNAFNKMNLLEILNLNSNKIESLQQNFFENLSNLKILRLNNNLIDEINNNAFSSLTKLERLNLSFNKIKSINGEMFKDLTNLKTLNFLCNSIENNLNSSIFNNLVNLRYLDLRKNKIKSVENDTFNNLDELVSLRLSTNFKFSNYGSDQEDFIYFRGHGYLSSDNDYEISNELKQFENEIRFRLAIKRQIEYYMSYENLRNDEYLNERMDAYGYVSLDCMCDFFRMRHYRSEYFQIFPGTIDETNKNERFSKLVIDILSTSKRLELKFVTNENVVNILRNVRVKSRH